MNTPSELLSAITFCTLNLFLLALLLYLSKLNVQLCIDVVCFICAIALHIDVHSNTYHPSVACTSNVYG